LAAVKKFFLTITFLFLSSCINNETPKDILAKDKMISLLIDIHLAEAKSSFSTLQGNDSIYSYFRILKDSIMIKHKTDTVEFNKSFNYYVSNPVKMEEIYAAVVDSLSLRETLKKVD
jgi:hypothetical protein